VGVVVGDEGEAGSGEDVQAEVAAAFGPLVVLFCQTAAMSLIAAPRSGAARPFSGSVRVAISTSVIDDNSSNAGQRAPMQQTCW